MEYYITGSLKKSQSTSLLESVGLKATTVFSVTTAWGVLIRELLLQSLHWVIQSHCTGLGPRTFPTAENHKYLNNEHMPLALSSF